MVGFRFSWFGLLITGCLVVGAEDEIGRLEFVDKTSGPNLDMVTSVEISADGKFLYAAAWQAATITVFQRDVESGQLTEVQTHRDAENLSGATAVRLSPDGRFAAANAFRSRSVVFFERDPETGKIKQLDVKKNKVDNVIGLSWAIEVAFSDDSKFLYVIDSQGPTEFGVDAGSLTAFRITDDNELEFIEAGQDSAFANLRGIVMTPSQQGIVAASADAGTLTVLNRDSKTGKTTTRQILEDEQDGIHALAGAMSVTASKQGEHIYVSAGRFGGDSAVSVFQFNPSGDLELVQELVNGSNGLTGFRGGNEITISPDGKNVYAAGTLSSSLACFTRDNETGRLTPFATVGNEDERLGAVAGICISPDGKFLYAAAEQDGTISIYRRKQ